ncbi:MAG: chromosomal replication initiator protein DnaA [Deltaproteobacteria bacterium]|nr:chromosomal replication initiator protein DnaA [Deltaproteobacteria bacterium]
MVKQSVDSSELVSKVLDSLKTKVSEFNFNNWFRSSKWSSAETGKVVIHVPNRFVRDWIIEHYLEVIKFEFFKLTGQEHEITFHAGHAPETAKEFPEPVAETPKPEPSLPAASPGVSSRYTFDNFVVGNSNQFVHAACRAVAANPAKNYNPLFIYGGVGLGKTHLLSSIGMQMKKHPGHKAVFVTGEQFTNEVINSIRYDKTYDLRKKYRQCDVLLIDDVQFIAGKERTMEEFFHTFNALYELRKQIVMTSDTLPKDIPNLEDRLRSRFGWGLLADIQMPDYETRCAILRRKAEDEKIDLPADVGEFIAAHIKTNIRDLEGALIRVSAFASLASVPITLALASEVLKNILHGFAPVVSIESIQEAVAEFFKLKICDLKSHRRQKQLAFPRQVAMYLCRKHVKASYPEIGQKFGGKDHTTVLHAFQKISKSVVIDTSLKDRIEHLETLISH